MKKDEFGISKTMDVMLVSDIDETRTIGDEAEVFDLGFPCPPYCDDRSIYNS